MFISNLIFKGILYLKKKTSQLKLTVARHHDLGDPYVPSLDIVEGSFSRPVIGLFSSIHSYNWLLHNREQLYPSLPPAHIHRYLIWKKTNCNVKTRDWTLNQI